MTPLARGRTLTRVVTATFATFQLLGAASATVCYTPSRRSSRGAHVDCIWLMIFELQTESFMQASICSGRQY